MVESAPPARSSSSSHGNDIINPSHEFLQAGCEEDGGLHVDDVQEHFGAFEATAAVPCLIRVQP